MSFTAFGELTPIQKVNWSRVAWKAARDQMFLKNFMSDTGNSVVHRTADRTLREDRRIGWRDMLHHDDRDSGLRCCIHRPPDIIQGRFNRWILDTQIAGHIIVLDVDDDKRTFR